MRHFTEMEIEMNQTYEKLFDLNHNKIMKMLLRDHFTYLINKKSKILRQFKGDWHPEHYS